VPPPVLPPEPPETPPPVLPPELPPDVPPPDVPPPPVVPPPLFWERRRRSSSKKISSRISNKISSSRQITQTGSPATVQLGSNGLQLGGKGTFVAVAVGATVGTLVFVGATVGTLVFVGTTVGGTLVAVAVAALVAVGVGRLDPGEVAPACAMPPLSRKTVRSASNTTAMRPVAAMVI
jgi:hypothetical protein